MQRKQLGFTLIELMIVVAIIAIISMVAYPSYAQHAQKTKRIAAQQFLLELSNAQHEYILDQRAYAPSLSALGKTLSSDVSAHYSIDFAVTSASAAAPTFTLTARAVAGGSQAADGDLSINHLNLKLPAAKW